MSSVGLQEERKDEMLLSLLTDAFVHFERFFRFPFGGEKLGVLFLPHDLSPLSYVALILLSLARKERTRNRCLLFRKGTCAKRQNGSARAQHVLEAFRERRAAGDKQTVEARRQGKQKVEDEEEKGSKNKGTQKRVAGEEDCSRTLSFVFVSSGRLLLKLRKEAADLFPPFLAFPPGCSPIGSCERWTHGDEGKGDAGTALDEEARCGTNADSQKRSRAASKTEEAFRLQRAWRERRKGGSSEVVAGSRDSEGRATETPPPERERDPQNAGSEDAKKIHEAESESLEEARPAKHFVSLEEQEGERRRRDEGRRQLEGEGGGEGGEGGGAGQNQDEEWRGQEQGDAEELASMEILEDAVIWQWFHQHIKQWAYAADSKQTTHPLCFALTSTDASSLVVPAIAFGKGAALLRHCRCSVGNHHFIEFDAFFPRLGAIPPSRREGGSPVLPIHRVALDCFFSRGEQGVISRERRRDEKVSVQRTWASVTEKMTSIRGLVHTPSPQAVLCNPTDEL
ncbi:hypothetical protein NCLIV_025270 [Neospora caninum Liverpool]|uniref:Uncharacterized protein n=1 Tax=Neospora caninum (strain Liverpool) TaxID=572307 RepID=F0VG95_NEOCL|nr:hypothetical protein NCLIV_025270 [Neospora caninum Liverpool]CBZ52739.1 hypothetical protein NCLIV_025270 [Neospora caninum Liverpool]CEL66720.1 TPA: hypothetical protein BN1204_025270 [Neospora caninum Liverpool]|eukprot:XP_003882771.1 hypothetical protein NCLIV_025270 [Neospora caninum Liverpool]